MKYLKPLILLLLVLGGVLLFSLTPLKEYLVPQKLFSLLQSVREAWWAPVILIVLYGLGGILALPGSVLTLVIGALYGLSHGMVYNIIASNLAASAGFLTARYLGRDFVARFLKGRLGDFDEKAAAHGFRVVFYLRLVPIFPFNGINFGAGLSKIKFRDYLPASFLGMLPGTFVYTYFAASLLAGTVEARKETVFHLVLSSLLFVLLSLLPVFYRRFKKGG